MLDRFLLVWLCLTSGLAYFWPSALQAFGINPETIDPFISGKPTLRYVICVTMFSIGWLLPKDEVNKLLARWKTVVAGTSIQFVTMPTLAFLVTLLIPLSEDLKIGVIIVGCVPGAMASNVLTLLSGGNVSYSVSLTTMATLISPFCVPLALRLLLGADFPVKQSFLLLLWTVVLPTITGHLCGRAFPDIQSRIEPLAKSVASLAILWIIAVVVGLNRDRFTELTPAIAMALLALNLGGYLIGFFAGNLIGLDTRMRRALALEIGMQNAGLGTALAAEVFTERPDILIPTALYTFGCMFTGTILARTWSSRSTLSDPH